MASGPFFDSHGRLMPEVVAARVKAGAPMPFELRQVIPEQLFYQLRQDCIRAHSFAEFMDVVRRYSETHRWGSAVTGHQTSADSAAEFITYQIITLGGLLGGAPDHGAQRILLFHMPSLIAHASPSPAFVPATVAAAAEGHAATPRESENLPIAYAAPAEKFRNS